MADAQQRLQGAVDDMMQRVNASKLRPLQKQTYLNMAACFDKHTQDAQATQCIEQQGIKIAQHVIQNEMGQFSARVQRCMQDCQDSMRDKYGELSNDNLDKAQAYMDKCSFSCADKHIAMIKTIEHRIEKEIGEKTK